MVGYIYNGLEKKDQWIQKKSNFIKNISINYDEGKIEKKVDNWNFKMHALSG